MKDMTLGWWDILACPTLFLTKIFFFFLHDFFFNFYLIPKFVDSLNICFVMKKSIIKTFEPSPNFPQFVAFM